MAVARAGARRTEIGRRGRSAEDFAYEAASASASSSGGSSSSSSSGGTSTSSSSGGTTYPQCATYAATYCRCLGTAASSDCVAGQTSLCNSYYSNCTYAKRTNCIITQNCAKGWLDVCSKEQC